MAFISTVRHRNFYSLIRRKLYKQDASKYDVERVAREKESELADGFYGKTAEWSRTTVRCSIQPS